MLLQAYRVLKKGGIYFCITLHSSGKVIEHLERDCFHWEWIHSYPIGKK